MLIYYIIDPAHYPLTALAVRKMHSEINSANENVFQTMALPRIVLPTLEHVIHRAPDAWGQDQMNASAARIITPDLS